MSVNIVIAGTNAAEAIAEIKAMASSFGDTVAAPVTQNAVTAEAEKKPAKEKKAKEEKAPEAKVEVLPPEKPKYVLQDAINYVREAIGEKDSPGHDEKCVRLKKLNQSFGVEKIRDLPADKIDSFMAEAHKAFPPKAKEEASDTASLF